ncbi:MAG: thiol-disulfide isomerase/thioredoxin [Candidatus Azotimanducaceae bacterium]
MRSLVLTFLLAITTNAPLAGELNDHEWKIVNYWSKSCAPCRVEIPEFNHLNQALTSFDVVVLGVDFDENERETTLEIAEYMGIEFPTLTRAEVETLNLTPPAVLPTTYILAPDNTVKAKLIGAQDQQSVLAKLAELGIGK